MRSSQPKEPPKGILTMRDEVHEQGPLELPSWALLLIPIVAMFAAVLR